MRLLPVILALCACSGDTATDCRRATAAADVAGLFTPLPIAALGVAAVCPDQ